MEWLFLAAIVAIPIVCFLAYKKAPQITVQATVIGCMQNSWIIFEDDAGNRLKVSANTHQYAIIIPGDYGTLTYKAATSLTPAFLVSFVRQ